VRLFPVKSLRKSFRVCFVTIGCCGLSTLLVPIAARAQISPAAFDDMKRQAKATRIASASELRDNTDNLDGKTVEMQGIVSGLLTREGSKMVMLKIGGDMVVLSVAPEAITPNVRAGSSLRLLVRVNASSKEHLYSILACAETPKTAAAGNSQTAPPEDGAEITASMVSAADNETDVIPQPPVIISPFVTTVPAPRRQANPLAARGGDGASTRLAPAKIKKPAPAAAPSSFDTEEVIQEQKPAYEAIVRQHNKKLRPEVVEEIAEALLRAGTKYNMDPRFLAAIIAVESDFDVACLSNSGAMGLGQLMPFNLPECGVKNPWNPTENIFGTACLLRGHLNDYKNRPNGTLLAVAAYNAGPGAVRRAGYKVPGGAQVQRYVWKVYYRYKAFAPDMF
jgi:hypothetical protein